MFTQVHPNAAKSRNFGQQKKENAVKPLKEVIEYLNPRPAAGVEDIKENDRYFGIAWLSFT